MTGDKQLKKSSQNIRWQYWILLLLVLATLSVYWQVRDFEFVNFDDPLYVTHNRQVQKGLTQDTFLWSFTDATRQTNYWAPLTWLTILLDYQIYGMNAGGFHLTNLFFHISNTLLVFLLFWRMTGMMWRGAFIAALFALHPLHVESVAWVTERKDVVSSFFWFLTMYTYAGYVRRPDYKRYFLVFVCFVLGMMAKPMLVTLPFVLLLLDYWPFGRYRFGRGDAFVDSALHGKVSFSKLLMEKAPFIILIIFISVMTYLTQEQGGAVKSFVDYPVDVRIANALVTYVGYIIKMFWPSGLAFFYPHPGALPLWQPFAAGAALVLITFLAIRFRTRHPYFIVGWLWYLGTLFPVIGLVVIGPYVMADRYTYISLIGLFIIITWWLSDSIPRLRFGKKVLNTFSIIVLLVLSLISWRQVGFWRNSIILCKRALAVTEKNMTAYVNLGVALTESGRAEEAINYYQEAIQIDPNNSGVYNNLGVIMEDKGRTTEAIQYYKKALQMDPDSARAYNNLGNTYASMGQDEEAIRNYREALRINPRYEKSHFNIGNVLLGRGEFDAAISHYVAAIQIDPFYAEAHNNLGSVLAKQGRFIEAVGHFREAVRIQPQFLSAQNNLHSCLAELQKLEEAALMLEKKLALDPEDPKLHSDLGDFYKKRGMLEKAEKHYQEAIANAPGFADALNSLGIIYAIKGDYAKARAFLNRSIASRPDAPEAYYLTAGTYARQKKVEDAVVWLKQAVERGFDDWGLLKADGNMEIIKDTKYYKELIDNQQF